MDKFLTEAFQALEELTLNEDTFNITADGATELKDFVSDDLVSNEMEDIIDPTTETEEDLEDSYIGKAILECEVCASKIYKDPSEVIINEEDTLANIGEECPYCQSADGYKIIGQVAEYKPEEETEVTVNGEQATEEENVDIEDVEEKVEENLTEDLENVQIETDKEVITVSSESKEETEEVKEEVEEIIAPVSPEVENEFGHEEPEEDAYEEVDIDEFAEEDFDSLGEGYLKRVYENVASYKTTKGFINGNQLKLEGIITFKSGKEAKTNFVFESKSMTKTGKLKFIGENKQFAKGRSAFTLTGRMEGNKLMTESLTYNYRAKDAKGASKRLYGRVCK